MVSSQNAVLRNHSFTFRKSLRKHSEIFPKSIQRPADIHEDPSYKEEWY
jgi:hypothetical protein